MLISLIGFSGVGKSRWSHLFEDELGFLRYGIDDLIEQDLIRELKGRGIQEVANWMGFPYEERYQKNAAHYLELEEKHTIYALNQLKENSSQKSILCTTGSVVYLSKSLRERLRLNSVIVHLNASKEMKELLYAEYKRAPKPIYWGDAFAVKSGESKEQALARSFKTLLDHRLELYGSLAHITIEAEIHRDPKLSPAELLKVIENKLKVN